jgi:hypothetical protein
MVLSVLLLVFSGCSTSGGREDGAVDGAVDGAAVDGALEDAALPDAQVVTPCEQATEAVIETVGTLGTGRYSPAGAVLADGRVLIAGGYDFSAGIQAGAELFDPVAGALEPTGSLTFGRNFAAPAVLADQRVLVIGGFLPAVGSTDTAELYDPALGTFGMVPERMQVGREAHTATVLPDGRVLVTGGLQALGFVFHASAELYDPLAGGFVSTGGALAAPRAFHAAVWIESLGSVLLVGGDSGQGHLATAERYELASDAFVPTANDLTHAAGAPAMALLDDGTVLVTGGANADDGTLDDAHIYDPVSDSFTPVAPMAVRRMAHQVVRLVDGRVLAVGGWSDSSDPSASTPVLEVYDPASSTWETLAVELARPRHDHRLFLLDDCRVLIAGGQQVTGGGAPVAPREVEILTVPLTPD